jgi:hypothetical protein
MVKLPSLLNLTQANVLQLKHQQEVLSLKGKGRSNALSHHEKEKSPSLGNQSAPVSKMSLLYPMSLKDMSSGELDLEERDPSYQIQKYY